MEKYKYLEVFIDERLVGTLALYKGQLVAFEYSNEWLGKGYSISPFSLPLQQKVFIPKPDPFDGLFGVFSDNLPDGWGRLLVDRMLIKQGIQPATIDMLNRLAIVGGSGMGTLVYRPIHELVTNNSQLEYDHLARECQQVLEEEYSEDLDQLFKLGGSSGGARPKILTQIDGEDWIVKFPFSGDPQDSGLMEYQYSQCAKKCGIEMATTKLFPSATYKGYFGTKRFDRTLSKSGEINRIHMITASALLETSHRMPTLDYNALLALTLELTKDYSEVEKMYRLMCFNVFAHNRDDHSKNFAFLYDETRGKWTLSPTYDLTYSLSIGGEHATCVNGNGFDPSLRDILSVADIIGIAKEKSKRIAVEIQEIVEEDLGSYLLGK